MDGAAPMMGQRPRGVSANVPQEAIDELLREDPTEDHMGEVIQDYPTNINNFRSSSLADSKP